MRHSVRVPLSILVLGLFGLEVSACQSPAATLTEVEAKVFLPSCAFSSCHRGPAAAAELELQGRTFTRLVGVAATQVATRKRVVPGDANASYLYEKLSLSAPAVGERMPPATAPDAAQLELVRSWIDDGARDN
jgi:hypothetical protein